MRTLILTLGILSLGVPGVPLTGMTGKAEAQSRHYRSHTNRHRYHQRRCRYSSGTTGLVAGGVGGALLGRSILGHGALGTIAGGVGGAFGGRAIDRSITAKKRCR